MPIAKSLIFEPSFVEVEIAIGTLKGITFQVFIRYQYN
jgi:hypothetical protein